CLSDWSSDVCSSDLPLWSPPSPAELEKGTKALAIAQSITQKSKRESAYIDAIASFYTDWNKTDHPTRCIRFEKAMERMYTEYPRSEERRVGKECRYQ